MENNLITLVTLNYNQSILFKTRLEAEGIECYLTNINLVQPDIGSGVHIQIPEKDLSIAQELLEDFMQDPRYHFFKDEQKESFPVQRILVPVDFSTYSEKACEFALRLAARLQAEICLLHVFYNPAINSQPFDETYTYQVNFDRLLREMEEKTRKEADEFCALIKDRCAEIGCDKVKISHEVLNGPAAETILDYCEDYQPQIIIIGARGAGGTQQTVMGTITAKVIEHAKIPVLAIPGNSVFYDVTKIKNVAYATNFDRSDFDAVRKLFSIMSPLDVKIWCVHIAENTDDTWTKVMMNQLNLHLEKRYKTYQAECCMLEHNDVREGLEEFILKYDIGLIALTTHKRNLFTKLFRSSMAKKMLFHTQLPLLVFHSKPD